MLLRKQSGWGMLADALSEVNIAKFATSIQIQDPRLGQNESIGDQISAAQLVLK